MNEITDNGLLRVDACQTTQYLRRRNLVVQSTCTPEPMVDLTARIKSSGTGLRLDIIQATELRDALDAFLTDAASPTYWEYLGYRFDLTRTWEGKVDPFLNTFWRFTGEFIGGLPLMSQVGDGPLAFQERYAFPIILGLRES